VAGSRTNKGAAFPATQAPSIYEQEWPISSDRPSVWILYPFWKEGFMDVPWNARDYVRVLSRRI
jgi:hypothetical protein